MFPMVGKLYWETKGTKRATKQAANKTVRQFRQFPTMVLEALRPGEDGGDCI